MCFNDWRIGRLIRVIPGQVRAGSDGAFTIPANRQRVGLSVSINGSATTVAGTTQITSQDVSEGYHLMQAFNSPWFVTLATHGELPTLSFLVTPPNLATVLILVTQWIAPEEMLAVALEQFQNEYKGKY